LFGVDLREVEYARRRLLLRCNPVQKEKAMVGRKERIAKVLEAGKKKAESLKKNAHVSAKKSMTVWSWHIAYCPCWCCNQS
jgi:hypothetical protein